MTDQPKITQPKLADAFSGGGPDRAAALSGLLPKRTASAAVPTAEAPARTPAKTTRTTTKQPPADVTPELELVDSLPAPRAPKQEPAKQRRQAAPDAVTEVGVYLDPEIVQQVRARRREGIKPGQPERTYDQILVDALDQVSVDELAAEFTTVSTGAGGGVPRRIRRPKGTGTEMIQHRLSTEQRDYLDRLAEQTGAPSRSALVNTVYRIAYR